MKDADVSKSEMLPVHHNGSESCNTHLENSIAPENESTNLGIQTTENGMEAKKRNVLKKTPKKITPKRSVEKRRAAENSEKKWKDALENEKTFDIITNVLLESKFVPKEKFKNDKVSPTNIKNSKMNKIVSPITLEYSPKSKENNFIQYRNDKVSSTNFNTPSKVNNRKVSPSTVKYNSITTQNTLIQEEKALSHQQMIQAVGSSQFSVIDDDLLKSLFERQRCYSCFTTSIKLYIIKNSSGITEELLVFCTKCKDALHKSSITTNLPPNFSLYYPQNTPHNNWNQNTHLEEQKKIEENENSVELLVCDVDVLDESHSKLESDKGENIPTANTEIVCKLKKKKRIRGRLKDANDIANKLVRPCVFCSEMQVKLTSHVKSAHADEPFVQNMLTQPMKTQAKMMRQLRSEGIYAENQRRLKLGRSDLLMIRNQGSGELSACIHCKGYYKKKLLCRHRLTCLARPKAEQRLEKPEEVITEVIKSPVKVESQILSNDEMNVSPSEITEDNLTEDVVKEQTKQPEPSEQSFEDQSKEIDRLKAIFGSLQHGIFTQPATLPGMNGLASAHDNKEPNNVAEEPTNNKVSPIKENYPYQSENDEALNEDQLLFDSLPAILSNSNVKSGATLDDSFTYRDHSFGLESDMDPSSTDNSFYLWQDYGSLDMLAEDYVLANDAFRSNKKRKPRSEFQYQFWTKEDEDTLIHYFSEHIKALKVPGKDVCREFLVKYPNIKTDWTRVKYKVYNQIQKRRKKMKK